jgi:ComEC/Rec2-related protein
LGIYSRDPDRENNGSGASARIFRYGEHLRFAAKLRPPRNFRNPGAFDYRGYLADQGIVVLASTQNTKVEVLPGFVGTGVEQWREQVHRSIVEKIRMLWSAEDAALMDAAVVGESAFLTPETKVDFQRSGTYHILVVSGMNVSIMAFVVFWVMRRLRLSDVLAGAMTVTLCAGYAFVTDVGPPVWRAVLMLTVYLGVRLLHRDRSMLNALGAAALGVMIADPKSCLGASFQLTFLAVFIIAAIAVPLLARTSQPYLRGLWHLGSPDFDRTLDPRVAQMRLDLRLVAGRFSAFLGHRISMAILVGPARCVLSAYEILCVSFLMQVGLALPMVFYFHRATVVGIPANALAVLLTGVLMPAAVLSVALSYVWLPLAKVPALVAALSLHGITGTVRGLGGLRIADQSGPHAGNRDRHIRRQRTGHCHAAGMASPSADFIRSRLAGSGGRVGQCCRSQATATTRSYRTYRDRCRPGRFAAGSFAGRENPVSGRRWSLPEGSSQNSISEKMWYRRTCGSAEFRASMQWRSRTAIRITLVASTQSSTIFGRASFGSGCCPRPLRSAGCCPTHKPWAFESLFGLTMNHSTSEACR